MEYTLKECIVIGAGISGLAVARWLKQYDIDFVMLERSTDIGGLWRYSEKEYGVMECTHINVSKYNYCYTDHSFPASAADFPHHSEMFDYIKSYADKNELRKFIQFRNELVSIEELEKDNELYQSKPSFNRIKSYDKLWKVKVKDLDLNMELVYVAPFVSLATGHHGTPKEVDFPGLSSFKGTVIHSVKYKSPKFNQLTNKRVLIVGIGNSAVDVAVNLVNQGNCPKITVSTRSGAWIIPNYIAGFPTDLYACRALLSLPWKIITNIFESTIRFIYGSPFKYGLNPKMRAMQTQPTVSPTLIHHIQRKQINIKPNVKSIDGNRVTFDDNQTDEYDSIILCTGYKIDLEFLSDNLKTLVYKDKEKTRLNLYKQVFHPNIGHSLGFIGFIQPSSGGLLTVSEMQARWFVHLMLNKAKLPAEKQMLESIRKDETKNIERFYNSGRHTIQEDPITYNDEIGRHIGVTPSLRDNFKLVFNLLFSSCGPAQYRLNGPDSMDKAELLVKQVPVTDMMKLFALVVFLVLMTIVFQIYAHPYLFGLLGLGFFAYKKLFNNESMI